MARRVVVLPTAEQVSEEHYILVDSIEDGTQKYSLGRLNREIAEVDQELNGSSAKAIANKAVKNALDAKAPLASPALSGTPTAPTAPAGTDTDQLATTAFVKAAIGSSGGGYTLPPATTSTLGGVKPDGTTITADADGTIHGADATPIATTGAAGKVKPDGTTITVDQDGTIHGADATPIATASQAGKVKPDGTSITVDQDGTIHGSSSYQLPPASTSTLGGVKPDGTSVTVDADGTIHSAGGAELEPATEGTLGGVMPDNETLIVDNDGVLSTAIPSFHSSGEESTEVSMEDAAYAVFAPSKAGFVSYVRIKSSSPYLSERFSYSRTVLKSERIAVFADGTVFLTDSTNIDSNGLVKAAILPKREWKLSGITDLSDYSISVEFEDLGGTTLDTLSGYAVMKTMVAGKPIIPDNVSISFDPAGRLASSLSFDEPLRCYYDSSIGKMRVELQFGSTLSNYSGYLRVSPADTAHAIFTDDVARDYALTAIAEHSFGDGISYEDGEVSIRLATASSAGIVKPDNETVFVDGNGVLSANVSKAFERYDRTIAGLQRRIAVLEKMLGVDTMTYEDGTLYVDSTYENGTLVTNREYSEGTLI